MVDVRASNEKLRARSIRILCAITGAGEAQARESLGRADGNVKIAVLLQRGLDPPQARALLARSNGQLRVALAEIAG
jgi:N-acetylmuramic acid 6-phosphate etherase